MEQLNNITESAWQNPQARHRILSAMKRREVSDFLTSIAIKTHRPDPKTGPSPPHWSRAPPQAKALEAREELKASLEAEKISLRQQVEAANERERKTLAQV